MKLEELLSKLEQLNSDGNVKLQIDDRVFGNERRTNCEWVSVEQYFEEDELVTMIILEGKYT